jgi:hypothetical protein
MKITATVIYPKPAVTEKVVGKRPLEPLRRGIDYDLVNISGIGHDPVTGRTYEECKAEWDEWMNEVEARVLSTPWWNLKQYWRNWWDIAILRQRQGMGGWTS